MNIGFGRGPLLLSIHQTAPAEFREGVYIGLTSAFSHTVCGVLGLTSRITGTVGKSVAALTMDEDFQRHRMLAQQPTYHRDGDVPRSARRWHRRRRGVTGQFVFMLVVCS
uniref:VPS13_C domain-containing protein n=1 Tax=Globodera pallida TaxID=36090 RepID=A0A183CJS6_GLOPA